MIKKLALRAQKQERTIRATTGVSIRQFRELCVVLKGAFLHQSSQNQRKRSIGGGRKKHLACYRREGLFPPILS